VTILARWKDNWYLAGRSGAWGDSPSFSMKVGLRMRGSRGFQRVNNYLSRTFDSIEGITFYPILHYRGAIVHPMAWHPESSEPMLKVLAGQWLPETPQVEREAIMESLRQQGWEFDHHHGSGGYVHVEDPELLKFEGPPPSGTS
jgi:hypothetical protein